MNKVEILKLYIHRQSIKKSILNNYNITLDNADKIPRNEVLVTILGDLNLTRNNSNIKDISDILESIGVVKGIYSGKRDWRGIRRLS